YRKPSCIFLPRWRRISKPVSRSPPIASGERASSPVKLLFDENLSPGLVSRLTDLFPNSAHVHECGLGESSDTAIWEFAAREDFTIVSKGWDFHDQPVLR